MSGVPICLGAKSGPSSHPPKQMERLGAGYVCPACHRVVVVPEAGENV